MPFFTVPKTSKPIPGFKWYAVSFRAIDLAGNTYASGVLVYELSGSPSDDLAQAEEIIVASLRKRFQYPSYDTVELGMWEEIPEENDGNI
jgi:hypothetical protein